jgi:hypothetical protein
MKIVMPGSSGHTGRMLAAHLSAQSNQVVVLTRTPSHSGDVQWDGRTLGEWKQEIDGADAVINLAGRSVNCRYTKANLQQMMDSRIDSTRVVGKAIAQSAKPPRVWLNASTATIYAHTFGPPNDDVSGTIGGSEPDVPRYWDFSIEIAKNWEKALFESDTPHTRKVAMRTAMTMSTEPGSVFTVFVKLARLGLLGRLGSGKQYVSWVHERDLARAIDFLIASDMEGPVNIAAPTPLPMEKFCAIMRWALGVKIALPATEWMLKVGTAIVGSDAELVLKSRRVVSKRLQDAGFEFEFQKWEDAVGELASRM